MAKTKILVVEDESLVARDIVNMLLSLGYEVVDVVTTGEDALQRAVESSPHLVLMDIILKGEVTGIMAAEKLWEEHKIPVIYLTAYTDEATWQKAKLTKPFGYILKPFEERELQTAIEMALYKSKMELQLKEREQWLSTILLSIGDALIATDKKGLITYMNPVAEKITGWKEKEALSKPLWEVFKIEDGRSSRRNHNLSAIFYSPGEVILNTKSGKPIAVEKSINPIQNVLRESIGYVLVFRDITEKKKAEETLKQSWEKLQRTLEGTLQAMTLTVEMRDPYTAGHQLRVSKLAYAIAKEMGLPEIQVEGLKFASEIHDIGKIYVPAEILTKPGRISDIEYQIIKTHPRIGYDILKNIEFPWPVAQIVLQHHERLDGTGYPSGLKKEDLLIESKILMVADVVEAMSSHRPYRPGFGIEKTLAEIVRYRGVLFDEKVVDSCVKLFIEKMFSFDE